MNFNRLVKVYIHILFLCEVICPKSSYLILFHE